MMEHRIGAHSNTLARLDAAPMLVIRWHVPIGRVARDRHGHYGVIYALVRRGTVHVLHAFKKTTQTTPRRHIDLARRRLKEMTQ